MLLDLAEPVGWIVRDLMRHVVASLKNMVKAASEMRTLTAIRSRMSAA